MWVEAENERPCGQPSVSTCVLLCLLASVPLYLFKCVPLYLCACALASASTWSTVRTCVLLFLFTCDTWSTKCEHLCTCALVCLCASLHVCLVFASASTWSAKCDHFCTSALLCLCAFVLACLQVRERGQPSVRTCELVRLLACVLLYLCACVLAITCVLVYLRVFGHPSTHTC